VIRKRKQKELRHLNKKVFKAFFLRNLDGAGDILVRNVQTELVSDQIL
jgi:hypothetical protein